ncbi:phage minor capsid protein [Litorihabitans aurantiacus]|uniref:Minor capsid protein n=1 Tax=Litorihabitans aurantiacus TaxID=1930061 RepID=A0AA37XEC1_9MICO|nr:phage minor capsid protein [Litorihabitans aurantiacus]GMA31594.1 hypothetical protein GCM10025875_15860 [Litorihabitans aurantiacus]
MPGGPEYGARLAAQVVDLVVEAELVMLRRVRDALAQGLEAPAWAEAKLLELQRLRRALTADLAALDASVVATVEEVVGRAYTTGTALAVGDLDDVRVRPSLPPAQFAAVQRIAADVLAVARGAAPVALRSVADAYQAVVAEVSATVLTGAATRVDAAQSALDRLLGDGVTGFRDSAGRNWRLESYLEVAVRTGTGRAAVQGHLDTLAASGQDLVYVIPGPRACPDCDQWSGRVLSISGATGDAIADGRRVGVTSLDVARGSGHLFGPNCRCSTGLYLPGVTTPNTERPDPAGYEAGQEQRRLERGVRAWKRREVLALTPEAKRAAQARVREWQGRVREHTAAHDLKRLPRRERITGAI